MKSGAGVEWLVLSLPGLAQRVKGSGKEAEQGVVRDPLPGS